MAFLGKSAAAAVLVGLASLATPAAAQFSFVFDDRSVGNGDFSFTLPGNPVPTEFDGSESFFAGVTVSRLVGGSFQDFVSDVSFFTSTSDGGATVNFDPASDPTFDFRTFFGPQLFTGPTSAPIFSSGSFSITEVGSNAAVNVTITDLSTPVVPAVPEPATWALMIVGFGAVGGALRRARKVSTRVRFA